MPRQLQKQDNFNTYHQSQQSPIWKFGQSSDLRGDAGQGIPTSRSFTFLLTLSSIVCSRLLFLQCPSVGFCLTYGH